MKVIATAGAAVLVTVFLAATSVSCAKQTWAGQITDSICGVEHEPIAEGQPVLPDKECTLACVRGGAKFLLVTPDGKLYEFANQNFKDLPTLAGDKVKVTGEMKDNAITITKIAKS